MYQISAEHHFFFEMFILIYHSFFSFWSFFGACMPIAIITKKKENA